MVIVLFSIDKSLIPAHEYSKTPHFSILDPWLSILDSCISKLERLDLRDTRIEFRGSSQDCQLTFERYCISLCISIRIPLQGFWVGDSNPGIAQS